MGNAEGFLIMWFIMNVKWATDSTIISQITDLSLVIAQTRILPDRGLWGKST